MVPAVRPEPGVGRRGFVEKLSKQMTYWNLPPDRETLWKTREGWKRDLARCLKASPVPVGPIDISTPFEVRSFDLRQRVGSAATPVAAKQWASFLKRTDVQPGWVDYTVEW